MWHVGFVYPSLLLLSLHVCCTWQVAFTELAIHTLDNVPPDTVSLDVANITGSSGQLRLTLNEPSTAYFIVLPHGESGPGDCPAAEQVSTSCISTLQVRSEVGHCAFAVFTPTAPCGWGPSCFVMMAAELQLRAPALCCHETA